MRQNIVYKRIRTLSVDLGEPIMREYKTVLRRFAQYPKKWNADNTAMFFLEGGKYFDIPCK